LPNYDDVPRFLEWWKLYPSDFGRRTKKAACAALWRERGLEERADGIIARLRLWLNLPDFAGDRRNGVPAYHPEALRFLEQRRYDDDPPDAGPMRLAI